MLNISSREFCVHSDSSEYFCTPTLMFSHWRSRQISWTTKTTPQAKLGADKIKRTTVVSPRATNKTNWWPLATRLDSVKNHILFLFMWTLRMGPLSIYMFDSRLPEKSKPIFYSENFVGSIGSKHERVLYEIRKFFGSTWKEIEDLFD